MSEIEQLGVRDFEIAALSRARIAARLRNGLWTPIAAVLRPRAFFHGEFAQERSEIWRGRGNFVERIVLGLVPLMHFSANFFKAIVASTIDIVALLQDPGSYLFSLVAFVVVFLVLTLYTLLALLLTNTPVLGWLVLWIRKKLAEFIDVDLSKVPNTWLKGVRQSLAAGHVKQTLSPAIAQFNLFLSASIYRRDFEAEQEAIEMYEDRFLIVGQRVPQGPVLVTSRHSGGGDKLTVTDQPFFEKLSAQLRLADRHIHDQAARLNLSYITISELDSGYGGPYCGLFTPDDNSFAVLAFKGTTPTDPTEFIIDADFLKVDASKYLAGSVHKGFYGSLFPVVDSRGDDESPDTVSPMYRILAALRTLKTPSGQPVKLWVTGHSLGAAVASLFFSRLQLWPSDLDTLKQIELQALYVYGCPAVGDTTFAQAVTRTPGETYRIIDGDDLVTRLPPNFNGSGVGQDERPGWVRAGSIFDFVQIGTGARVTRTGKPVELSRRRELLEFFKGPNGDTSDIQLDGSKPTTLKQNVSPMLWLLSYVLPALADHSTVLYDLAVQKTFDANKE